MMILSTSTNSSVDNGRQYEEVDAKDEKFF